MAVRRARKRTRPVTVGPVQIGGDAPPVVQAMTKTDTRDVAATLAQIDALAEAGSKLVRVAVPDERAAAALAEIAASSPLPVVADIHFNYRLALQALQAGVAKLRLNPGNIGAPQRVRAVVQEAVARSVPIRVGVNAGSLDPVWRKKYGGVTAAALVASALSQVRILEKEGCCQIVISIKASDVPLTVQAYRMLAEKTDYPLHIGITEAGTELRGAVFSAVGLGVLLAEGIGDTLRVSLTADPVSEVRVAYDILAATGWGHFGPRVVSCPTCGRCTLDMRTVALEVERRLQGLAEPLVVAVMGCVVNGPGEARAADVGLAGGKDAALIFRSGEIIRRVPPHEMVDALLAEIEALVAARRKEQ